ncbi:MULTISPECIES: glutamate mutase L [unclassified Knoellia]|uniref:glutamate mutase L n=1 Tax=Knoellia altitudinis TaxID=3404795 RepID=UPI003610CFB1
MPLVLCVDVGSTFTKAVLVDVSTGALAGAASSPTTVGTDVMDGVDAVCGELATQGPVTETLVCSSAGGGLRIAVVGYEREVTAEAGHRVALSAGGRVVHVSSGPLTGDGVRQLRAAAPDLVLLVGGTDGGNADVLRHNAARLANARVTMPVVVAGNADVAEEVSAELTRTGRRHTVTSNVLPRIGVIAPGDARGAIRAAFLEHVIGGKGLSRGRGFTELVRAATPDAVLQGVELLADVRGEDVLVIDIGGATTDVYSVLRPQGEDAEIERDVAGSLWHERTVEADLGMRWNAVGIVEAAEREHLALSPETAAYAARVTAATGHRASTPEEWEHETGLARVAAVVAARRHGRSRVSGDRPRPLADVGLVLGSGGVLRHGPDALAGGVLGAVVSDHAGGWTVPAAATQGVDTAYVLFACGLLADPHPEAARALALTIS